jgi:hypothetical protein
MKSSNPGPNVLPVDSPCNGNDQDYLDVCDSYPSPGTRLLILSVLLPSTSAFPDVLLQMRFEEVCIVLKSLVFLKVTSSLENGKVRYFFMFGGMLSMRLAFLPDV